MHNKYKQFAPEFLRSSGHPDLTNQEMHDAQTAARFVRPLPQALHGRFKRPSNR